MLAGSVPLVVIVTAASFALPANASATGSNGTISGPACEWNLSAHATSFYGHLEVVQVIRTGIETMRTTPRLQQRQQAEPEF